MQRLVHLRFILLCVHLGYPAIHRVPSDCVLRKGLLNMRKLDFFLLTHFKTGYETRDILWPDPMPTVVMKRLLLASTNIGSWSSDLFSDFIKQPGVKL